MGLRRGVVAVRTSVVAGLAAVLIGAIDLYKRFVSPMLPPACRFAPTCSSYAREAVIIHGPLRGGWMASKRLCRCHPFCEGGLDPVPPTRAAKQ